VAKKTPKAARVLVIDDVRYIADMYADELESHGYSVGRAYDGATGIALARATAPDVVLLNYMMPKMNGFEVLAELQSDPRAHVAMKVIMMSAFGDQDFFRERAADAGAFASLGRPLPVAAMLDLVENSIGL
jgi:CheY-like chemotaxis protein